jgi:hypothetical protein
MDTRLNVSFEDTEVAFQYKSDRAMRNANFIFSSWPYSPSCWPSRQA